MKKKCIILFEDRTDLPEDTFRCYTDLSQAEISGAEGVCHVSAYGNNSFNITFDRRYEKADVQAELLRLAEEQAQAPAPSTGNMPQLAFPLRAIRSHGVTPAQILSGGRILCNITGPDCDQIAEYIAEACNAAAGLETVLTAPWVNHIYQRRNDDQPIPSWVP